MADNITVPMARASILWLLGEYSDRVPKIAPDVLRKMAKGFIDEVWIFLNVKIYMLALISDILIFRAKFKFKIKIPEEI